MFFWLYGYVTCILLQLPLCYHGNTDRLKKLPVAQSKDKEMRGKIYNCGAFLRPFSAEMGGKKALLAWNDI